LGGDKERSLKRKRHWERKFYFVAREAKKYRLERDDTGVIIGGVAGYRKPEKGKSKENNYHLWVRGGKGLPFRRMLLSQQRKTRQSEK